MLQLTLPVGTVLAVLESVTVAVHVVEASITSEVGVQLTTALVFALVTSNELLVAPVSPALEAASV